MTDMTDRNEENFPSAEQIKAGNEPPTISIVGMQNPEAENSVAETMRPTAAETDAAPAGQPEAGTGGETETPAEQKFDALVIDRKMPKGEVLLEAKGLVKAYHGRRVVNGVSFTVHYGEIVGLLGPNGAGKTTSFYMVTGLIKPNDGYVSFKGVDVSELPMYQRARMGMGYLAQEPTIFRKLSVEDNILAILQTLDISSEERRARLEDLLNKLDLARLRKQKAMTLSGGERRRLEITRALVTNPEFILLDEPFSGVDPIVVNDIQVIIKRLRDAGLGILITDHNVRETLNCVDHAYLMADGKVCVEGTSDYLINSEEARKIYLGPAFVL